VAGQREREQSVAVASSSLDPEEVTIRLTRAEALVLFEWLHRNEDRDEPKTAVYYDIVDPAERAALWNLSCDLESALVEPFMSDYHQRVEAARAELRPQGEVS
jgi:hypothetical protein